MRRAALVLAGLVLGAAACGSPEPIRTADPSEPPALEATARLPAAPGEYGPSLVAVDRTTPRAPDDPSDGEMLSDVDSCSTCHPDVAAQWSASAHSFASFGNPIYRVNVELMRGTTGLGHTASLHCGGCHDMPLVVDGMMTSGAPIPPADLRSHSGVTCRLCHGIDAATKDGNGSYVWSRTPIDAPTLGDPASIARHAAQVSVKSLGAELCVSCHRGFLSPDMGMPVHLSGIDEPGAWRNSAYTGNGIARLDSVAPKSCIDCHMEREPASADELGARSRTIASHRFVGGHTWMAAMRGDADHLRRTQAKLEGAASIDIAGARLEDPAGATWFLPAETARVAPGTRLSLDVVIRNLLVGHRFPGGVLDIQDTWIELEIADATGKRLASSGLAHERDPRDEEAHVLRTLVVDDAGRVLEEHEMAQFRTQIATHTLAAREAQAVRYAFDVPRSLAPSRLPLTVTARLRHRSRTLRMQANVCEQTRTPEGQAFVAGARGAREVELDPCKPQPITLVASTQLRLGAPPPPAPPPRPTWERLYEHGMALTATVTERLDEARTVLEAARAAAPDARARAMIALQLAQVASKQGRADDALALVATARALLATTVPAGTPAPSPPVLDAVAADALARVWRWQEAVAPARSCVERAPQSSNAWVVYARVLGSVGDNAGALAAARTGLELAPRDPDLLRSQALALSALGRPDAAAALAAFDRYRAPDNAGELRIQCAAGSPRCARDREHAHTIVLRAHAR